MKKTFTVDFPDDFVFPEKFDYIGYYKDLNPSKCKKCPLMQEDRDCFTWCGITGSGDNWNSGDDIKPCPFYDKKE